MAGEIGIITQCPECGQVRLKPDAVTLRHCLDDDAWSYRFTCPVCERRAIVTTPATLALVAVGAGLRVESWTLPTDLDDHAADPPLTHSDMLELQVALLQPDFIDRLSEAGQGRAA